MQLKISILLMIAFCQTLSAETEEEPITLETKTGKIEGTLLCPVSSKKIPVVLIISGSGPTDRNGNNPVMINNSLKMLAEGLFQKGIASVRYDKRGIAASREAAKIESNLRFETYIDDAIAWVDLLNNDAKFSEIIIAGHSEGSLIGMIASRKKEVTKFISLAGSGSPAANIIKDQLKEQPPMVLDQITTIIEKLEKGETTDSVPLMLYSLFRPDIQPYLISWFKYHPKKEIAKLNKPVLIIQGTTDIQVGISEAEKLADANKNAKKHIIQGMNHILKPAETDRIQNIRTYSNPELPLKEGLIDLISQFIYD
ncbi:alpha/beta hydrolase [Thermophagus sp. OGC60D27]|uniref:alpha/beta hydrolase n=1 Tax=Thermophagus sp. OGC60D27 TaxID=3458415 RepID=UPI004037F2A7